MVESRAAHLTEATPEGGSGTSVPEKNDSEDGDIVKLTSKKKKKRSKSRDED
jgi:hypothetical protein